MMTVEGISFVSSCCGVGVRRKGLGICERREVRSRVGRRGLMWRAVVVEREKEKEEEEKEGEWEEVRKGGQDGGKKEKNVKFITSVKNPGTWALGVYGAYLLGGCGYYMAAEGWSFGEAMYFTIQTGLGVGYGDLVPSTPASRVFTSGYVLVGNVFFAAALALFVEAEFRYRDDLLDSQKVCASNLHFMSPVCTFSSLTGGLSCFSRPKTFDVSRFRRLPAFCF